MTDPPLEALGHFKAGRLDRAAEVCQERLADDPSHAGSLRMLASVMVRAGKAQLAVLLLEQALIAQPEDALLLADLGSSLAATGSTEPAAAAFLKAIEFEADNVDACFGLLELGKRAELGAGLRDAIARDPKSGAPYFALANTLLEDGRLDAAAESYARAVELEPAYGRRHVQSGTRLVFRTLTVPAARMYRWGLALKPGDPELLHMLAALEHEHAPGRASDGYVSDYFDAFADDFDETLVHRLDYQAPDLVVGALMRWLPGPPPTDLAILDAGCGTGLCGPLLRPLSARLVGVDLSERMLDRARASGHYDEIRRAELVSALHAQHDLWHAIVSADVLVYFGELEGMFRAAAGALRPGGLLVASMERQDSQPYVLLENGRYAHSPDYVSEAAQEAGLTLLELEECVLRLELGMPVAGQIAVLRRATAT